MREALLAGVLQINVESEPELQLLDGVARSLGVRAPTGCASTPTSTPTPTIKSPPVAARTSSASSGPPGTASTPAAAALPGLDLAGLAVHIGSQLIDVAPFREAFRRLRDLVAMLRADGLAIRTLDLGGGLGIPYGNEDASVPSPEEYAGVVAQTVGDLGCRLIVEPGRMMVGNAGVLVARVLRIKEGSTRTFVVLDAGMNDLLRPALYGAWHDIVPVREPDPGIEPREVDIVGPICETSDIFASARKLAAGGGGRPAGDPHGGRLRPGDGVVLQRPAAAAGGSRR